ncbi:MAG TPA: outer membrane beta-barrel protein, partial [Gemmatimonadota bacterium]|nr:outer membrane beta-barrel protein [Gemmatimonadota bacterium]
SLSVSEEVFASTNSLSGLNVGGLVAWNVSDRFAVQLAGMYTRKGSKVEESGQQFDVRVDYFEIPLLARVTIPTEAGQRISFHLFAGPAVSFETSCKFKGDVDGESMEIDCDDPLVDAAARQTTDYSLLFGGGVGIGAGPGDIQLDFAYDLGLRNLNSELNDNSSTKNRTLMVTAGYILPIGR